MNDLDFLEQFPLEIVAHGELSISVDHLADPDSGRRYVCTHIRSGVEAAETEAETVDEALHFLLSFCGRALDLRIWSHSQVWTVLAKLGEWRAALRALVPEAIGAGLTVH
jgi:hypothetical protein